METEKLFHHFILKLSDGVINTIHLWKYFFFIIESTQDMQKKERKHIFFTDFSEK